MEKIQIKAKSLPSRCETCHQSDYFDPAKGFCQRCDTSLEIHKLKQNNFPVIEEPQQTRQLMPFSYFLAVSGTIVISFLLVVFLAVIIIGVGTYETFLSRLIWIILAISYLALAWLSLLAMKKYPVVQEMIVLLLCLIFGAFIIIMGVSIASHYPPK
ncbi:MAG: hypothetical protein FD167_2534 [bacterium]|nr:MAG: hypothetical protein FD167_2534 [bacterium]